MHLRVRARGASGVRRPSSASARHTIPVDRTIGPPAPPAAAARSRGRSTRCWTRSASRGTGARVLPADDQMMVTLRDVQPARGRSSSIRAASSACASASRPSASRSRSSARRSRPGRCASRSRASRSPASPPTTAPRATAKHFAPAQFFKLSDDEKLSRPGFEALEAGKRIGSSGFDHPAGVETTFGYEDIVVDLEPNTGLLQRRAGSPRTLRADRRVLAVLAGARRATASPRPPATGSRSTSRSTWLPAPTTSRCPPRWERPPTSGSPTPRRARPVRRAHGEGAGRCRERTQVVAAHEAVAGMTRRRLHLPLLAPAGSRPADRPAGHPGGDAARSRQHAGAADAQQRCERTGRHDGDPVRPGST